MNEPIEDRLAAYGRAVEDELGRRPLVRRADHAVEQPRPRGAWIAGVAAAATVVAAVAALVVARGVDESADEAPPGSTATKPAAGPPGAPWTVDTESPMYRSDSTPAATVESVEDLPTGELVSGPRLYGDATLMSMLFRNFDVAVREDHARVLSAGDPLGQTIADCMHRAGFLYVEWTHLDAIVNDPRLALSPAEFAATYGFGAAADALGLLPPIFGHNPNDEIRNGLPAERAAAFEDTGQACLEELVDSGVIVIPGPAWADAHELAHRHFESRVASDRRTVAAGEAWRDCAAQAGLDFDAEDPSSLTAEYVSRVSDVHGGSLASADPDRLEAIMHEEIAAATAVAPCMEDYRVAVRAVIADRFDEYLEIFDAALAAGVVLPGEG